MSIPASTNTQLPVQTGMPNNVASIESVGKFVMVGLLPSWLRVKWSLEQWESTSLGSERMTTILRFAPSSEGKTWRPRSATSSSGFLCMENSGRGCCADRQTRIGRSALIEEQPALLSLACSCCLGRFHQGQGDDDTDSGEAAGDVEDTDVASEDVLDNSGGERSRNRADSIGRKNDAVVGRIVLGAEIGRRGCRRDGKPRSQSHPEGGETHSVEDNAAFASQQHRGRRQHDHEQRQRGGFAVADCICEPTEQRPSSTVEQGEERDQSRRRRRLQFDDLLPHTAGNADGHQSAQRADDEAQPQAEAGRGAEHFRCGETPLAGRSRRALPSLWPPAGPWELQNERRQQKRDQESDPQDEECI